MLISDRFQKLAVIAAMLLLSLIWGGTFVASKYVLQTGVSVGALLAIRFLLALVFLGATMLLLRKPFDRRSAVDGLILGIILAVIFWLQVDGLRFTTVSKSGFITGLVVIFTPMVSLLLGERFKLSHGMGALLACVGLFFLVRDPQAPFGGWNRGDSETLVCAVLCGFHVTLTARFSRRGSPWVIAFMQISTVALLSCVLTFLLPVNASAGQSMAGFEMLESALKRPEVWFGILYLAAFATALGFYMQTALQSKLSATEAAIIFTTEPVFSALIATSGLIPSVHESLTLTQASGGALIVAAMLLAELGPRMIGKQKKMPENNVKLPW